MNTNIDTVSSEKALPRSLEELTPEWFTSVLATSFPGVVVEHVEIDHPRIIWGTATKVFARLDYAAGTAADLPADVCVKAGFEQRMFDYQIGFAYETEAAFYRDVAPQLDTHLPRCLYAESQAGHQGLVILEDLDNRKVTFGRTTEPWSADDVAKGLEAQASWHGATWDAQPQDYPTLQVGCVPTRTSMDHLLGEVFDELIARPFLPELSGPLGDGERMRAAFEAGWALDDRSTLSLSHGDAHVAQTFIEPDGRVSFLDWQGACITNWAHDVSYFIIGALTIEDRRAAEEDLVNHYLHALKASGGPQLSFDDAWWEYRRHTIQGYVWVVTPSFMQPEEAIAAITPRNVQAIHDHDPFSLLGVA